LRKGYVTRECDKEPHIYIPVPKVVLLHAAFERMLMELAATPANRAHIPEALHHG
jgi:hypothetical protein